MIPSEIPFWPFSCCPSITKRLICKCHHAASAEAGAQREGRQSDFLPENSLWPLPGVETTGMSVYAEKSAQQRASPLPSCSSTAAFRLDPSAQLALPEVVRVNELGYSCTSTTSSSLFLLHSYIHFHDPDPNQKCHRYCMSANCLCWESCRSISNLIQRYLIFHRDNSPGIS